MSFGMAADPLILQITCSLGVTSPSVNQQRKNVKCCSSIACIAGMNSIKDVLLAIAKKCSAQYAFIIALKRQSVTSSKPTDSGTFAVVIITQTFQCAGANPCAGVLVLTSCWLQSAAVISVFLCAYRWVIIKHTISRQCASGTFNRQYHWCNTSRDVKNFRMLTSALATGLLACRGFVLTATATSAFQAGGQASSCIAARRMLWVFAMCPSSSTAKTFGTRFTGMLANILMVTVSVACRGFVFGHRSGGCTFR